MRIALRYDERTRTFSAANRKTFDLLGKITDGSTCMVNWLLSRNKKHHGLAWVFAGLVADAINDGPGAIHEPWDDERVMDHVKMATGHVEIMRLPANLAKQYGTPIAIRPGSISFAKMGQDRFSTFFDAMLLYVQTELCTYLQDAPQWDEIDKIIRRVRDPRHHNGGPKITEQETAE